MNKPTDVITIDNADIELKRLIKIVEEQIQNGKSSSEEMKLLKSIRQKFEFINSNMFYGDGIRKSLIPKSYNVHSLWRVELFNFWRMLYTISTDEKGNSVCWVIDILGHKSYDDKFGYRKK